MTQPVPERDLRIAQSAWARSFACDSLRPLIICRGPVRKEAMEVFASMGIQHCGMLLSEKDSTVYPGTLAPELRGMPDREHVHSIADYSANSAAERGARIAEIIDVATRHGYDSVFAGYGFMAEDEALAQAVERAGLLFIGPCSETVRRAGFKDEAKSVARSLDVSVTPGIDDLARRTVLARCADADALAALASQRQLSVDEDVWSRHADDPAALADILLAAARAQRRDLFTLDALCEQVQCEVASLRGEHPGYRIRLKAIGGGGGKGQRVLPASPDDESAGDMLREILSEVKATGPGDDKNLLLELNIENTRHLEIQLLGNGDWCVALGGRDCSLQMHEQKLLEVSLTRETLAEEIAAASAAGQPAAAETLQQDLLTLERMEEESMRFGAAVGLDSASTFECILDRSGHFFMEMNTRIQVEHRVSELCYSLKFTNPENPQEHFVASSLIQAMALIAKHRSRLPKPELVPGHGASVEARINASNHALAPHAGGVISHWSAPGAGEILDEQGICTRNPDTGAFVRYTLSGAYDSNIALLLTAGASRRDSYAAMAEALRKTSMRGQDLATNVSFHYGLVEWLLARGANARPGTGFVLRYLSAVGLAAELCEAVDFEQVWRRLQASYPSAHQAALAAKGEMLLRPLRALRADPHRLAGWLARAAAALSLSARGPAWLRNPLELLAELYHYLKMDWLAGRPAAHAIWDHDHAWLEDALAFYRELRRRCPLDWPELSAALARPDAPDAPDIAQDLDPALWQQARDAHAIYQCGAELMALPSCIAAESGFDALDVAEDLSITVPERLHDGELQQRMLRVLAPPPSAPGDTVVAQTGGMFYARNAPDAAPFVAEGSHFEQGDPLYIIEVMKMFTTIKANFAGTVERELFSGGDGSVVRKGQALFRVRPDEEPETVDDSARDARAATDAVCARLGLGPA